MLGVLCGVLALAVACSGNSPPTVNNELGGAGSGGVVSTGASAIGTTTGGNTSSGAGGTNGVSSSVGGTYSGTSGTTGTSTQAAVGGASGGTTTKTTGGTGATAGGTGNAGSSATGGTGGGYDTRITSGDVSEPLPIPHIQAERREPAVGFNKDQVLVEWSDARSLTIGDNGGMYATRISVSDQRILDPAGVRVFNNDTLHTVIIGDKVVSDGTDFLLIFGSSVGATTGSFGAFVSGTNGDPLDAPFSVGDDVTGDAVFDGTQYWVCGASLTGVGVQRIDPQSRARTAMSINGGTATSVSIAAGQNEVVVVWVDDRYYSADKYDIYAARISKDGTVIDPGGAVVCDDPGNQTKPKVVLANAG